MPRSWSHFTLVSPRRNHSSSPKTERVWTFLVVTSGKPAARSKRIWWPKTPACRCRCGRPSPRPRRGSAEEVEVLLHGAETTAPQHEHGSRRWSSPCRRRPRPVPSTVSTCTRPPRPSAVPCAATYDAGSTVAREPLGDAGVEAAGHRVLGDAEAGAERPHLDVGGAAGGVRARPTPISRPPNAAQSGRARARPRRRRAARPTQPGRCRSRRLSTTSPTARSAARGRSRPGRRRTTGPERTSGGAANASRSPRRIRTSPAPHSWTTSSPARHAAGLEPGVRAAQRRVAGERQLAARREDPQPVVGARVRGRRAAGTWSRRGWSSGRTPPSARRSRRRRRARPRPGCRAAARRRRRRPG